MLMPRPEHMFSNDENVPQHCLVEYPLSHITIKHPKMASMAEERILHFT